MYFLPIINVLARSAGRYIDSPSLEIPVIYRSKHLSNAVYDGVRYIYDLSSDLAVKMNSSLLGARFDYQAVEPSEDSSVNVRIHSILLFDK